MYSQQSGRELDNEHTYSSQSVGKDQLFSTKPRLARSGSKSKLDRSQLPPTDPSSLSRQTYDYTSNNGPTHRITNSHVEVIGKGYADDKPPVKQLSTEILEDKQTIASKPRAKIIKGKQIDLLTTTKKKEKTKNSALQTFMSKQVLCFYVINALRTKRK